MNIVLCHTPLHLLIAALEAPRLSEDETLYIVVEDAKGLHALASALLETRSASLLMLPGTATSADPREHVPILKGNALHIRRIIRTREPSHVYIFYDLRIEAQTLLNHTYQARPKVTLLEDGVYTYQVAQPFKRRFRSALKNKIRYGWRWRGARWVGQHPLISQVRSFYPSLLRDDLKPKSAGALERAIEKSRLDRFLNNYGTAVQDERSCVIVVPHPSSGLSTDQLSAFLDRSLSYCSEMNLQPLLKYHPRDPTMELLHPHKSIDVLVAEKSLPIELLLYREKHIHSIIGYRTSAIHVTAALHRDVQVLYYEHPGSDAVDSWIDFFDEIGAERI